MELQELYHLIDLQPEIVQKLEMTGSKMDLSQIDPYLVQMLTMETAESAYSYLSTLFQEDSDNLKMLYCQMECARRIFEKYQEKNIPETIFRDTMKCFTRFVDECDQKNGRMFFDRGWWTYRQISMDLFRIGELEYQFQKHEGENVIDLHIPSDADLSAAAVNDSFKQADHFFREYYSDYQYEKYTCNSWLMSPALKPLLSENSKILSFQKRFTVIQENKEDKDFIEWLFQVPVNTDYEKLPTKTSLQRKAKELLLDGGTIGSAFGIMWKKPRQQY